MSAAIAATVRHARTRALRRSMWLVVLALLLALPAGGRAAGGTADEIHYTLTSPTSVAFDWRGTATDIRYGTTTAYGSTVTASAASPVPVSSAGPFEEVQLTGLTSGTTYHYSVGGGVDHTFTTTPTGAYTFDVIADVGSSREFSNVVPTQSQVAADSPAFVLVAGDLAYADPYGQPSVDQHFNDMMTWSQQAAYMPAWGNHEWQNSSLDDLRNYKGRFKLPNPQTSPSAPAAGCCGEDWSWFDAGGVRFISYPEPYSSTTWTNWQSQVDPIFAAAQADPSIHFIVTFGHRPAYSTGLHPGEVALQGVLNALGDSYSKYVLNFNGHSHDYERFQPIHGVTHITAAGGGAALEPPWASTDSRTAFRAMHLEHVRVEVSASGLRVEAVCGPPTVSDDISCVQGSVMDSYTIGANPPPPPTPAPTLYVDKGNANCSDGGSGTADQPFCTIRPAASRVVGGQTVLVSSGTYNEQVTVSSSGTAAAPINFAAAPGANVTVTGGTQGFYIVGRSYVTVQGFNVTQTSGDGIVVKNSSNITIRGNRMSYCGQPVSGQTAKGIRVENSTDSTIWGNTVDHNTSYGIYVLTNSTRNTIHGNHIFNNAFQYQRAASGIRIYTSPANTISSNVSHDNEDSGIEFDKSINNLAVNNVTYNNGDHGIDVTASSTGARIISNTVYKSVTAGIDVEGTSTGATIANNVAVDNGIASPRTHSNIRVDSSSISGTTMDYDVVYLTTPDTMIIWNNASYATLTAFKAAVSGQEARGVQADPRFSNAAAGEFTLTAGSPAIDSANSGASGQRSSDSLENPRLDDPATPNTGAGPRTYDDRGAFEFDGTELDHLVVTPATATIAAGASQTYTAQGYDTKGGSLDVTASTNFSISPDGACTANVCTATKAGPHTVIANDAGVTATASLTVNPAALDHLALSPASATIPSGGAQTYVAYGRDRYENSLGDVTSATTFSIAPDGSCTGATCTAAIGGTHTVTGTDAGKTGTASLTVTAAAIDHIVISPATATITAGGSQSYTAQGYDAAGNPTGDVTAFTTFTISPDGACIGSSCSATTAGDHTVTGNDGGKTSTAQLSVNHAPLDHLVLAPASSSITAGGSQAYTAEGRDQYDNSFGDVTSATTFSIGPDGSCTAATCTASTAGSHVVTGTDGGKTGTATLDVVASNELDHIVVTPATATIAAGDSQSYTAEGFDAANNSLGDVTASTTFAIGPDGTCTGASCTATASGPHTVTATDAGKVATASLTVTAAVLDHLVLSPASASISAGGSQTYAAEGADQYGNSLGDVTSDTTFSISPDGTCTAATCTSDQVGPHTVTGTDAGKTGTASLEVRAVTVDHIVISPSTATITAGGSQAYSAEGFDADGNSLGDVTSQTTFAIAPNGSCTGTTCTATTAGTHTVTGTRNSKTSDATLTVTAGPLDHLALSPATASIPSGGSQSYTADGRDEYDNSLGDLTASATFSIAPDGSCTGATCTASVAGAHTVTGRKTGKVGTASLTVTASNQLDHIVISPSAASITAGGSQAYTAQGFDAANNSLGDVTSSTTFSITPNGSCTGNVCTATVAGGHTVTGNDAGKTSTSSLTVNAGPADHLALSPATATIAAGGSRTYTAQSRDQYDNAIADVTASTTFGIAPNGSCTGAACTASVTGAHTVTGTSAGKTGTASLTVVAGTLDHIVVSPATATVSAGTAQTYTAEGFDASNNSLGDVTAFTTFTIAPEGTCAGASCTPNAGGAHTVTGNDGGKTATASLNVSYVKNSGFETDVSGWNTSGSGTNIALTRVAGGHSGGWAAKMTNTGTTTSTFATLQDSPNWVTASTAGTYTGSLWVRADSAGAILKLKFQEYSGATLVGSASSQITLSTSWQQVTLAYPIKAPGSTLDFQAYVANPPPGTAFYADDASIVVG